MNKFKLDLLFYGNTFIPLSSDCEGCHNFNYLCDGSVYREDCPIGQVKDIRDSEIAAIILDEINYNHFLLARICGYNLLSKDMKEHISNLELKIKNSNNDNYKNALKKAIKNYNFAINTNEKFINEIKERYSNKYEIIKQKENINDNILNFEELVYNNEEKGDISF